MHCSESDNERTEKTIIREPIEKMLLSRMRKIVHNIYEVICRRDNEIIVLCCGKHSSHFSTYGYIFYCSRDYIRTISQTHFSCLD